MAHQNPGKREGSPEWNVYESRGRQNGIIIPAQTPDSKQPIYPVLSSRQILPTTLPPKNYAVSRQRSTSRELLTSSRKFLNLIHDGSKFCLAPGDVTQEFANEYETMGNDRESRRSDSASRGSWPFRSQSFDRSNLNRRSVHLPLHSDEDFRGSNQSFKNSEENLSIRNAHIRKMSDIEDILKSSTTKKQSSSYVSKGVIPTTQQNPSYSDYPVYMSSKGSQETGFNGHENPVSGIAMARKDYFRASLDVTSNSQDSGYNISQFSTKDSGYKSTQNSGQNDTSYNISQFTNKDSGSVPKRGGSGLGFASLVPFPSSSYGIHRRSRSSAVLLRAQKFESRLKEQQQQQQQLQHTQTAPTRASTERLGMPSSTLPWTSKFEGMSHYQAPLKPRQVTEVTSNLHKTCSSPSIFAMAGDSSWKSSPHDTHSDIFSKQTSDFPANDKGYFQSETNLAGEDKVTNTGYSSGQVRNARLVSSASAANSSRHSLERNCSSKEASPRKEYSRSRDSSQSKTMSDYQSYKFQLLNQDRRPSQELTMNNTGNYSPVKEIRRASIPKVEPYVEISPKRELYFSSNKNGNNTNNNNTNGNNNSYSNNGHVSNINEYSKNEEVAKIFGADDNSSRYLHMKNTSQDLESSSDEEDEKTEIEREDSIPEMEEWQPDKEMYLKPDSEEYIKQDIEKYFKPHSLREDTDKGLNKDGTRYSDPEPSPLNEEYESEDDLMPEMEDLEPEHDTFFNHQTLKQQEVYKPETSQWKPETTWRPEVDDNDDSADSDVEKEVEQILAKTPETQFPSQQAVFDLRSLAVNNLPKVDKEDYPTAQDESTAMYSSTTTYNNNQTLKEVPVEREGFFQPALAKRFSLTSSSHSGSKSSLENDDSSRSPQKEVIQYTVSIKLRGNSIPRHEASPEDKTTRFVDIKLTDCSSNAETPEDDCVPIPVLHFPDAKVDTKEDEPQAEEEPPLKRPTSIPISTLDPRLPWRSIPIEKVDKSPNFEVPAFTFVHQTTPPAQVSEDVLPEAHTLEIEELTASEVSGSPQLHLRDFQGLVQIQDADSNVGMSKSKSYVEFEELSEESTSEEEEDIDDIDQGQSDKDYSGSDNEQDNEEELKTQNDSIGSEKEPRNYYKDGDGREDFEKDEALDEEDDEDSFATCSSDLSSKRDEKFSHNKSSTVSRSYKSRTKSPNISQIKMSNDSREDLKQEVVEEEHLNNDNWDSADAKTEVEVSDIEEEEDLPDIEAMAELKENEVSKLMNGESPSIVSRYLSRIEREKSETESEDESFEAFRAMRMRTDREAAPPERDINEDDTETAEFQTKLRQLGSNPSSASTTQRETGAGGGDHSSCDAATPDISAAATLSTDGKEDGEEEKSSEISRSRSQEIYLQRKNLIAMAGRKKFGILKANQDLEILKEKAIVDNPVEEEDEESKDTFNYLKINHEAIKTIVASIEDDDLDDDVFEAEVIKTEIIGPTVPPAIMQITKELSIPEDRPSSTDGLKKLGSASSSTQSLNALRHSRSFDSGLPMSPEVRRRLKAISQRSPSELSLSVFESKKGKISPIPGKQSIEDLASSVENLREKLSLFPYARAGKLPFGDTEGEELDQVPHMISLQGGLTRSRSWQGFGAAHRTARHQAFWENQRYEQVTDKDLSLPPPPASKPPETCLSSSNNSLSESGMSVPPPTGRIGRMGAISRRYRPLSNSPSSSPLRYQKRSLTIPLRSPLTHPAEKSASYDSEINTGDDESNKTSIEKATSLCYLPSDELTSSNNITTDKTMLALSDSLKQLSSSRTRDKRNDISSSSNKTKFGLPGALSLDSIATTSKIEFSDGRPREWSPKKKKKLHQPKSANEISSSSDEDEGASSGEEYSLECNPPPIEKVNEDGQLISEKPEAPLEIDKKDSETNGLSVNHQNTNVNASEQDKCSLREKSESNAQVVFRQHYLSIIQEEEEHSDANGNTPGSSRASSRPSSIYGLSSFNPNDLKEMFKGLSKEEDEDTDQDATQSETNSPSCKSKLLKSVEDNLATSPSSTVNSILTNHVCDNMSLSKNLEVPSPEIIRRSPESLQEILRKLPPPPKQPPSLKPLWSPDRRKKFAPDVKTVCPQDSTIAEDHIYENVQKYAKQKEENLKKFNLQMQAESLRSLSSSSSSFSYEDDNEDKGRPNYRTPPSPPTNGVYKALPTGSGSPKTLTKLVHQNQNSPLVKRKITPPLKLSPKNSPPVLQKSPKLAKSSPPISPKSSSPRLPNLIQTSPLKSPKLRNEIPKATISPKNSPITKTKAQPDKVQTPTLSSKPPCSPKVTSNSRSPEKSPPRPPNMPKSSPPRIDADCFDVKSSSDFSNNVVEPNKIADSITTLDTEKQASCSSFINSNTIEQDKCNPSLPTPDIPSSKPLPLITDHSILGTDTLTRSSTNHSKLTPKPAENEAKSLQSNNSCSPPRKPNTEQVISNPSMMSTRSIGPNNGTLPKEQVKKNEATPHQSKHLQPKLNERPQSGNPDAITALTQNGRPVVPQPTGSSKSDSILPKSILKDTTRRLTADKEEVQQTADISKTAQQIRDEVSLEELIKKYNGPRRNPTREPVTTEPSKASTTAATTTKQQLRLRSSSCNRPSMDASSQQSQRRVSTTMEAAPLAGASSSGKFSSMKELLKNVVGSQKNVQQQKLEFAQKGGQGKQNQAEEEKSSGSKVSRFFKSAFGGGGGQSSKSIQTASKTSSVSQSTISLATDGSTSDLTSKKQLYAVSKSKSSLKRTESFNESEPNPSRFDSLRRNNQVTKKSAVAAGAAASKPEEEVAAEAFTKDNSHSQELSVSPHWMRGGKKVPPVSQPARQQLLLKQNKS